MTAITASPLTHLAKQIRADLARRDDSREEWIAATLDLCRHLAEARAQFRADTQFGEWLAANNLGLGKLNAMDRAAAIEMGQHIEAAKQVLETTERRSLQLIHGVFCLFLRPKNPAKRPAAASAAAPKKAKATRHRNKAITPMAEKIVATAVLDGGKTLEQAVKESGIGSVQVAKVAIAKEEGRREAASDPQIDQAALSLTAQQKLDAAIRQHKQRLDLEFEQRVMAEVAKRIDELVLPHYQKKTDEAERIIKARKGLMTRAIYRQILSCLHPDRVTDEAQKARFVTAFHAFSEMELVLCNEAEMPTTTTGLPRTYQEMMARRKKARV